MAPNTQNATDECCPENGNQLNFSAEKFVDNLLTDGFNTSCDESSESFNSHKDLPPFYDENLYDRGRRFYKKHIFALFMTKLLGLICVLAIPTINQILVLTNMSSTVLTSYRRYLATMFHMCIWYQDDFKPGSKTWQSIIDVRKRHNSASLKSCSKGQHRISQRDMALTQFGFMGLAVVKREKLGIYYATEDELKGYIHIWRTVGYLMGIEDRFNICRESVEETTEICKLLIEKTFLPLIEKKDKSFLNMSDYLVSGMWCFQPFLSFKIMMNYLNIILKANSIEDIKYEKEKAYLPLKSSEVRQLKFIIFTMWTLKYELVRLYHKMMQNLSLWLMKVFPFLAYYKFGKANSHVKILS